MKIIEQIKKYNACNEQEQKDKETMLKFINSFEDVLTRDNEFGHFTSSAWVINKEKTKVLMIYHNIYDSWTWTGGHADGEDDLLNVAIREVCEETGIKNVVPVVEDVFSLEVVCVNGHVKREKYVSSHLHMNLTFLLEADEDETLYVKEDENSGVKWFDINEAVSISKDPWIKVIYQKIIDKSNSL